MSLNEQFAFLSPVQFVKVNQSNLEEAAEWCGGKVFETESRRKPGTMEKYVWVPTPENAKIGMAFPGMYITKRCVVTNTGELKVTWAVFARAYFDKNYFTTPAEAVDNTWAKKDPKVKPEATHQPPAQAPTIVFNVTGDVTKETSEQLAKGVEQALASIPRDASLNG